MVDVKGIFLILDQGGIIEKIVNYGADIPLEKGSFLNILDTGSHEKASRFINEIRNKKAAYDWEMNLKNLEVYHFSGFSDGERIYVAGSPERDGMIRIYRAVEIEAPWRGGLTAAKKADVNIELFNELTRLNNELSSARRELLKKNAELERALEEKEMLLREINHRVKNNLMIISSLLNLQSRYVKDLDDLMLFKEAQTKARSMAMLHERLYRSGKHKRVEFGEYLQGLLKDLYYSFAHERKLKLETHIDDAELDINTVVPLVLILNELFTNAVKHAFPGESEGTVSVSFRRMNGTYRLEFRDDGAGLPEGFDWETSPTMGMQIIRSLAEQLNADLNVTSDNGTCFSIEFRDWEG